MGNVHMEAAQINYRGGEKKMSVEEVLKNTSGEAAEIAQLQTDVASLRSGLTGVEGVLNASGKVLNFTVAGEGVDYVAEFRGATTTTIIADKKQGDTITASVRLFLNTEAKKIEAGYFDGTNWQYQTLVQFT